MIARASYRGNGTIEKIERYDQYGRRIAEAFYDENGVLMPGIDGWAAMKCFYNEEILVAQILYGADGLPVGRKIYSESGTLIARDYIDSRSTDRYEETNADMLYGGPGQIVTRYGTDGKVMDRRYFAK